MQPQARSMHPVGMQGRVGRTGLTRLIEAGLTGLTGLTGVRRPPPANEGAGLTGLTGGCIASQCRRGAEAPLSPTPRAFHASVQRNAEPP